MTQKGLIVALDVEASDQAKDYVQRIGEAVGFYKVAPSLMMEDPLFVPWLLNKGKKVFLDCKWYDIPSQVKRSVQAAGEMGVTACTIHAGAGSEVIKAAASADPKPLIWGVTVLTSMSEKDVRETGISVQPGTQVLRLACLAQANWLDGVVCSAKEIDFLRSNNIQIPLITPGIQYGQVNADDQKRVSTPKEAWEAGANWIVMGRSILQAEDPRQVVQEILALKGNSFSI